MHESLNSDDSLLLTIHLHSNNHGTRAQMSSYLRSWFTSPASPPPVPKIEEHEPEPDVDDDDADTITIKGDDDNYDDTPPAFPALNSAQRIATPSSINELPRILSDGAAALMPPPPAPVFARRIPGVPTTGSSSLSIPNTLALPTSTTKRPKVSRKVQLAPGHGALDWANLKNSGKDLRVFPHRFYSFSLPHRVPSIGSKYLDEDTTVRSQTAQQT